MVKESVMKKFYTEEPFYYEWPYEPHNKVKRNNRKKTKFPKKQSEEGMIRSLQIIFCKGYYRSWALAQERKAIYSIAE